MSEWRDIESAPKDGTRFIASYPCGTVTICKSFRTTYSDMKYFHYADDGSVCCSDQLVSPDGDPTHWMPLPNPPEETK